MTTPIASLSVTAARQSEEDMFSDIESISPFTVKKIDLATQLNALMVFSRKSRSDMAASLGWKKSRITKILSGNDNLTIKTISEFSAHLGYDFDVIFHAYDHPRPIQPWQIKGTEKSNLPIDYLQILNLPLKSQSSIEVLVDILSGNGSQSYFSFDTQMFGGSNMIDIATNALPASMKTDSISTEIEIPVQQKN